MGEHGPGRLDRDEQRSFDEPVAFDGCQANRDYAFRTLEAAKNAGADVLCLCDTNGGSPTERVANMVADGLDRMGYRFFAAQPGMLF